ncbi:acyl-CoA thioesterase [Shimia sp. R11_0]|uniref:acyl-CoA thioesterase n=1 Tax=Shimia sp. R11_0 TaxID=2821096 RepID=UPI001AD9ECB2|nr:acyl-CoA thioesterase [Shimia sp. R11_0]MBO9477844.1 acyl-CoA thioesterase [Shimia sp. R11_0]
MPLTFQHHHQVVFGDCDPAGLVDYPNIYRWMDGRFQRFLHRYGGHGAVCDALNAVGLGMTETQARYRRPLRDSDALTIRMEITDWAAKSYRLSHRGYVGEDLAFEGIEGPALFEMREGRIRAGQVAPLKTLLESPPET